MNRWFIQITDYCVAISKIRIFLKKGSLPISNIQASSVPPSYSAYWKTTLIGIQQKSTGPTGNQRPGLQKTGGALKNSPQAPHKLRTDATDVQNALPVVVSWSLLLSQGLLSFMCSNLFYQRERGGCLLTAPERRPTWRFYARLDFETVLVDLVFGCKTTGRSKVYTKFWEWQSNRSNSSCSFKMNAV